MTVAPLTANRAWLAIRVYKIRLDEVQYAIYYSMSDIFEKMSTFFGQLDHDFFR